VVRRVNIDLYNLFFIVPCPPLHTRRCLFTASRDRHPTTVSGRHHPRATDGSLADQQWQWGPGAAWPQQHSAHVRLSASQTRRLTQSDTAARARDTLTSKPRTHIHTHTRTSTNIAQALRSARTHAQRYKDVSRKSQLISSHILTTDTLSIAESYTDMSI